MAPQGKALRNADQNIRTCQRLDGFSHITRRDKDHTEFIALGFLAQAPDIGSRGLRTENCMIDVSGQIGPGRWHGIPSWQDVEKTSSFVLASLRGSTYRSGYVFASSLAAAALEGFLNILLCN
jgi:hypothetical protein